MRQTMLNNTMKHFIYKTTHKNGKYYVGRHSTENINDGYIGSGRWPTSIKDRTELTREILEYATTEDELILLEQQYLEEHYGKLNCMNMSNTSTGAPTGDANPMRRPEVSNKFKGDNHWTKQDGSEESIEILRQKQNKLVEEGVHNLQGDRNPNKDGRNAKTAMANGTHINLTNNPSIWRSAAGIHHWQHGNSPNKDGVLNQQRVEDGTHNFLGPELNAKRVEQGTHNFLGSEGNLARLAEGTHPSQSETTCLCCTWTVPTSMFKRWHGDNCHMNTKSKRYNPKLKPRIKKLDTKGEVK